MVFHGDIWQCVFYKPLNGARRQAGREEMGMEVDYCRH
jgi:hypothetical protein